MPPPMRVPVRWTLIGVALGVVFLAVKASLGETTAFCERFLGDGLGVLAGVAFGAAGLNEVGRRWLRRPWTVQTARTVFDYMGLLVNELAATAARCYAVVEPITEAKPINPIGWAFAIPNETPQQEIYESYSSALDIAGERMAAEPDAARLVVERARAAAPLITKDVEHCRTLMGHIGAYREEQAHPLEEKGVAMWKTADELHEHLEDDDAALAILTLRVLLSQCHQVALVLTAGFEDIWKLVAKDGQGGAVIVSGRYAKP